MNPEHFTLPVLCVLIFVQWQEVKCEHLGRNLQLITSKYISLIEIGFIYSHEKLQESINLMMIC
jgi:hypothetical protein